MNNQHLWRCLIFGLFATACEAEEVWQPILTKAANAAESHDFSEAADQIRLAIDRGFGDPIGHYYHGCWSFRAGQADTSLRAFDRYLERVPSRSNSLWQRGISCYYAGKYALGAKQFADYQRFHHNDVENAVWRYLCQAKVEGKLKAREAMLPIENDRRVPMMQIYSLFKGKVTPEVVLEAAAASKARGEQAKVQAMHAHLYLALFYDSEGQRELASQHARKAEQQFRRGGYMWSVAVVHRKLIQKHAELTKKDSASLAD